VAVRVAINGFGRIGRMFFRAALRSDADIDVVAANDLGSREEMAHLLAFDSVAGRLDQVVSVNADNLRVGDRELRILSEREPGRLPWADLGVDVVIESTRFFTDREKAARTSTLGRRSSSYPRPPRAPTPPSLSASTTATSTRKYIRSSPTLPAPRTASCRWSRCSMTPSASIAGS
jgi:hypothetical protein